MSIRNLFKYVRTKDENLNKALLSAKDQFDNLTRAFNVGAEPSAHALVGAKHTGAGLTIGHFLKALGATTFGFAAHGLAAADVGAPPTTRTISPTSPLAGGGDLSADRSFSLAGLSSLGVADYLLKVKHDASAWEYQSKAAVDPRDYGADPGASAATNDAAFQAAFDTGKTVVGTPGVYNISTKLNIKTDNQTVHLEGVVFQTTADITALEIGEQGAGKLHQFIIVTGINVYKTSGASTLPGIILSQLCDCTVQIELSQGFHTALKLQADVLYCVYNQVYLNKLQGETYCLWLAPSSQGWVNENTFWGGRYTGTAPTYLIYSPNSGSAHGNPDNNKYICPCFEPTWTAFAVEEGGTNNVYFFPRTEGTFAYGRPIHFNSNSQYCFAIGNFNLLDVNDEGTYNNFMVFKSLNRIIGFMGRTWAAGPSVPLSAGTYRKGSVCWNTEPSAGGTPFWQCVTSGTYSDASDSTGSTTLNSPTITGMTDTSDFFIGEYVEVSAGFAAGPHMIKEKTAITLTLDVNATGTSSPVTVSTPDPVWKAAPALAS
jgi:hypothetical protein